MTNAKNDQKDWVKNSVIAGLSAMVLTGVLLYFPFNWLPFVLIVGVLVFIIVLLRNPKYFYRRMASYLIGAYVILASMPLFNIQHYFDENSFAKIASQSLGFGFFLIMGLIILGLIIADLLSNKLIFQGETKQHVANMKSRDNVFQKLTEFEVYIRSNIFEEIKIGTFEPNNWNAVFELDNYLRAKSNQLSDRFYNKSNNILSDFQEGINRVGQYMRSVKSNIESGKKIDENIYSKELMDLMNRVYNNYRDQIDDLRKIE